MISRLDIHFKIFMRSSSSPSLAYARVVFNCSKFEILPVLYKVVLEFVLYHISNMPCLHHDKISRTCIVVLRVDILPCDEMLWLLKHLKCVHHVKISKSYFKILHVDILPYDELLRLLPFTFEIKNLKMDVKPWHHFQRDTLW